MLRLESYSLRLESYSLRHLAPTSPLGVSCLRSTRGAGSWATTWGGYSYGGNDGEAYWRQLVQLGEVHFFDEYNADVAVSTVTNPDGNYPTYESPDSLHDGDYDTKWLNTHCCSLRCEPAAVGKTCEEWQPPQPKAAG